MWYLVEFLALYIGYVSTNTSQNMSKVNKNGNTNQTRLNDDALLSYYYGNQSNSNEVNEDYLDLSTVDIDTAKKILKHAQTNYVENYNETELDKPIARDQKKSDEAFHSVPFFIKKALDLMKQSIYSTRYRLQDTRQLRKRYADDACYNMAIFYGSLMQLRMKMDNVYATMKKFPHDKIKFIWYLGLYERCVALNVDVTYMVETMFKMMDKYMSLFGESFEKTKP